MNVKILNNGDNYDLGKFCDEEETVRIFLAGTIDDGTDFDWRYELSDDIIHWKRDYYKNIILYNPIVHGEYDDNAICWEQYHMDESDYIFMFITEKAVSSISMLELGEYASSGKLFVFCNDKYTNYKNVENICHKFHIPLAVSDKDGDLFDMMEHKISLKARK